MKIATLLDLYTDQLQDMYNAEKQLTKALPKMAKAATNPALKAAFTKHAGETQVHMERAERLLKGLGKKAGGKVCEATVGLVKEGSELIEEDAEDHVRDAGLIVAAQKIEHYEIATYGSLRTFATLLGRDGDAKLIEQTLDQEKQTDVGLTELAMGPINEEAVAPARNATKPRKR